MLIASAESASSRFRGPVIPPFRARTSDLLRRFAEIAPERVSLGAVAEALGERSVGIVVLCLALPNAVPGPYMPGFSTVLAVPIVWIGLQLLIGRGEPRLPRFLHRISLGRQRFVAFVGRATPLLVRIERFLAPRPSWLTAVSTRRTLGLALAVFGVVLAMPVPFANVPIAIGISVLALGLTEEDSRALACGLVLGLLGCLWALFLVTAGVEVLNHLLAYFR